jgi:phospholipid/cholesterol/gamma-HCH transport system ATP-binding protein
MPGNSATAPATNDEMVIIVENLVVGYGEETVLENVSFTLPRGGILAVLGESGCGKTTLLRALTGLVTPTSGRITIAGAEITVEDPREPLAKARMHLGVLFQSGALLNSLTVAENVALQIEEFTDLPRELVDDIVQLKLDLVRLGSCGNLMPAELSGGMRKRAALARATALDPQILLCDEPSSGLDPVTSAEIEDLLLELNEYLGVTLVVITHELATISNLSGYCIMLDKESKGIIASGPTETLIRESENPQVRNFFKRQTGGQPAGSSR